MGDVDALPAGATVAIVVAMAAEADPVVRRLGLTAAPSPAPELPFRWYEGRVVGRLAVVATNGRDDRHGVDNIGTNPAVLNTWLTVQHWRPAVVVSAGTAGGFASAGGEIGDLYLSAGDFVFHDRRIAIPGFDEYGHGRYPSLDVTAIAARLGAKLGVVSTSNSLDYPDLDAGVMRDHGASVKEMEAAAVAWVCWLTGTPVFAVKAITDLVDHPAGTVEQFLANLGQATDRLASGLAELLALEYP